MKFTERQTQFPGRKLLTIVNDSNQPVEGKVPIFVNIENAEGDANPEATPVSAVNLNKGNWRDDKDLSFRSLEEGESLPIPLPKMTQIYTKPNGETWIVPPQESAGEPKVITDPAGSLITVGGNRPPVVEFERNPQDQICENRNAIANLTCDLMLHRNAMRSALDAKANLYEGAMSDPQSTRRVASMSEAISSVRERETMKFIIRNDLAGIPFAELDANYTLLLTVSRPQANFTIQTVETIGASNNTLHASKSEWDGHSGSWVRPKGWKTIWNGNLGLDAGATLLEAVKLEDVYRIHAWMPNPAKPVLTTGIVQIFPGHGGNAALIYNFGMMRSETMESYSAQLQMTIGSTAVYNRSWPVGSTGASNQVTIHRIDKEVYI